MIELIGTAVLFAVGVLLATIWVLAPPIVCTWVIVTDDFGLSSWKAQAIVGAPVFLFLMAVHLIFAAGLALWALLAFCLVLEYANYIDQLEYGSFAEYLKKAPSEG